MALAVDVVGGVLSWTWIENMKGHSIAGAVQAFKRAGVEAVVWDRAGGHRTLAVREVGIILVEQPAASPELNPAERVFEELRRKIEGRNYDHIEQKKAAVEAELETFVTDPAKVRSLTGWAWIRDACQALPPNAALL